jgi:hypothetical protein
MAPADRRQSSAEVIIPGDPAAVGILRAQGEMQEADFRTNQGDDFVPGFHGTRGWKFGSTRQASSGYIILDFFEEFQGWPKSQADFFQFSNDQPRADLDRPTPCRPIRGRDSAPPNPGLGSFQPPAILSDVQFDMPTVRSINTVPDTAE